jgi:hypothetical protein
MLLSILVGPFDGFIEHFGAVVEILDHHGDGLVVEGRHAGRLWMDKRR